MRARVSDAPLRIRGTRLLTPNEESCPTYRLSIAAGRSRRNPAAPPDAITTSAPNAWTYPSWEQGQDLEILAAFAGLQAQGCWTEVQTCVDGGLCFDVELALDPKRSVVAELNGQPVASNTRAADDELDIDNGEHVAERRDILVLRKFRN